MSARALGLVLGYAADRLLGDPERLHPVAGFGAVAATLERRLYADSRARGIAHTGVLIGGVILLGTTAERMAHRPVARTFLTAATAWAVLGGRSLEREAVAVLEHLQTGNLPAARQRLTHLVGRDTSALDASAVARAVVESVAENTSDAVVAPLVWGAVAGVPGLLGYRAANTLDAMVGYRNPRHERYGWASARFDDLVNLPASRLTGVLALVASPGRATDAWRTWRRDAGSHPSPNAGVVEAVFAAALGVRLGGRNVYGIGPERRVEHRAILGNGHEAEPEDIPRAVRLARRVSLGALAAAVVVACWPGHPSEAGAS